MVGLPRCSDCRADIGQEKDTPAVTQARALGAAPAGAWPQVPLTRPTGGAFGIISSICGLVLSSQSRPWPQRPWLGAVAGIAPCLTEMPIAWSGRIAWSRKDP